MLRRMYLHVADTTYDVISIAVVAIAYDTESWIASLMSVIVVCESWKGGGGE